MRGIDAAAKAAFLTHLRAGLRREDAAAVLGFSLTGFYGARARDPAVAAEWKAALAAPPAAARRIRSYGGRGEVRIAPANRRILQLDAAAQEVFLAHLSRTCDWEAAAAEAGVSPSTATLHPRNRPEFAAACELALADGYVWLEAEAVRQRLAAQERLRKAIEDAASRGALPAPDGAEFERLMQLLARRDRNPRRAARHARGGPWTFDAAIHALDKRLRALGVPGPAPLGGGDE
jgi:hypothetical protein